jgi:hypothetical protein
MPKKPESLLYERLKENLSNCLITRIESWVSLGIPDTLLAFRNGAFVPVELKVVTRGRKVEIRPHQVAFHVRHAENGNDTFILVEYRPAAKSKEQPRLLLYRGAQVLELVQRGIDTEPLAEWHGDAVMWRMLAMRLDGGR